MSRTYADKTSAADKSIGFDYQYYHFLWRVITLKSGESVGLEVFDDVHTELENSRQILVQLKFSNDRKANGDIVNLTCLDIDLWKSLSNWSKVITDETAGRKDHLEQLKFVNKTDFLLVSSKSDNQKNAALTAVRIFQVSKDYTLLKSSFIDFSKKAKDLSIKGYVDDILNLNDDIAKVLFTNLAFDLGHEEVIEKCRVAIREHHIDDSKIDEVFSSLDSRLREENYSITKNNEKIIISFEDFHKNYRIYFDRARNNKLKIRKFTGDVPEKLENQIFIQQLLDIEDIEHDDVESMADFTRYLLQMKNCISEWYKEGEITKEEIDEFKKEAIITWTNRHRQAFRGSNHTESEMTKAAQEILDAMRATKLSIASQELPIDICNGQFYDLSNIPEIGWHKNWKFKFK